MNIGGDGGSDVTLDDDSDSYASRLEQQNANDKDSDAESDQVEKELPTASIESIDSLGMVKITFSKPMVVVDAIKTLNQDGILKVRLL